ncbi:MAG: M48 family metallopeptidase [Bacteroidia bacterium]|nr:M48 family metallopeptidase [Methylotenera sp.]
MLNHHADSIEVLLFGAGLPTAGITTRCYVKSEFIHVDFQQLKVAFSNIKATVGGFDHNQLQLHWQVGTQTYMLMPANAAAEKALHATLPVSSIIGLKSWKTNTKAQSMVWNTIVYGAGLIALLLVLFVWQYDNVMTWVASKISMETEKKIGDSVLKSLKLQGNLLEKGAAVDAVKKVGNQLTQGSRYHYQWFVVQDDAINAFAVPSGIIFINSGLLKKADSANELAAVLAHEVQHVERRHALKNMLNSAGVASVVLMVLGDANAVMLVIAQQVSTQYFSRQVEAEADLKGAELLNQKHIDASGMVSFFKKMDAAYKNKDDTPEWLSSHPETLARIKFAEQFVKSHPCKGCAPLTWDKTAILADLNTEEKNGKNKTNKKLED